MSDRLFADCCYGTDQQHAPNRPCPQTHSLVEKIERLLDLSGHAPIGVEGHKQSHEDAAEIISAIKQCSGGNYP